MYICIIQNANFMEQDIPKIDLPEDCIIGHLTKNDIGLLSLYGNFPCRLKAGVFVLCLDGELEASLNLLRFKVKPKSFITVLPGTILQIHKVEGNIQIYFIGFSSTFIGQNNIHNAPEVLYAIRENPVMELEDTPAELMKDYFALLAKTYLAFNEKLNKEILSHLLSGVLKGVGAMYESNKGVKLGGNTKAEQICKNFEQLVIQNYNRERAVAWYAQQLNITAAHLSTMVKQSTGKTCIDIITAMVIMDAKAQLKSTDQSIHDIAISLNFSNMSFFGKYFKRYVGMGPLEYRNS